MEKRRPVLKTDSGRRTTTPTECGCDLDPCSRQTSGRWTTIRVEWRYDIEYICDITCWSNTHMNTLSNIKHAPMSRRGVGNWAWSRASESTNQVDNHRDSKLRRFLWNYVKTRVAKICDKGHKNVQTQGQEDSFCKCPIFWRNQSWRWNQRSLRAILDQNLLAAGKFPADLDWRRSD